jgi:hypothetical protein
MRPVAVRASEPGSGTVLVSRGRSGSLAIGPIGAPNDGGGSVNTSWESSPVDVEPIVSAGADPDCVSVSGEYVGADPPVGAMAGPALIPDWGVCNSEVLALCPD